MKISFQGENPERSPPLKSITIAVAGAAGFEPAVPGLGGRCIIQAMLHAQPGDRAPPKKCEGHEIAFGGGVISRENQALMEVGGPW